MSARSGKATHHRRQGDFPLLVVSQDYELFFARSGSFEKCLFEPTDLLMDFAEQRGLRITFFVDAGMLCRMQDLSSSDRSLEKSLDRIRAHVESIAQRGHEIGLHVHPHWEDTRWVDGGWDFSATRYQLRDFSDAEVESIFARYARVLNELCDGGVKSYRAGGFCIEPFERIAPHLRAAGIDIDSSVVPGLHIDDAEKGVDFRGAPDKGWWRFSATPTAEDADGSFLEVPVTPARLPLWHYWGRAVDRVLGRQPATVMGDGAAKAIGRREVLRRLAGGGRASELSMDAPKAAQLAKMERAVPGRQVWHVMGHPKLLGKPSLEALSAFIDRQGVVGFETLSRLVCAIEMDGENWPPN